MAPLLFLLTTTLLFGSRVGASVPPRTHRRTLHTSSSFGRQPLRLPPLSLLELHSERRRGQGWVEGRGSETVEDGGGVKGVAASFESKEIEERFATSNPCRRRHRRNDGLAFSLEPAQESGRGPLALRGGGAADSDEDSDVDEDESSDFDDLIASDVSDSELDVAFSGEVSEGCF